MLDNKTNKSDTIFVPSTDWKDVPAPILTDESIRTWCQIAGKAYPNTSIKLPESIKFSWKLADEDGGDTITVLIAAGVEVSLYCHMDGGASSSKQGTIFSENGPITILRYWKVTGKGTKSGSTTRASRRFNSRKPTLND